MLLIAKATFFAYNGDCVTKYTRNKAVYLLPV